jgi:tripartite-type tricarboxylate transporter receptor subunit TctC
MRNRGKFFVFAGMTLVAFLFGLIFASPAWVQEDYPKQGPITLICTYPPGGATDMTARLIADMMSKTLHQAVIVENKAGAGGTIGYAWAAKQKGDGYTLVSSANSPIVAFQQNRKLPYTPADFKPICKVCEFPQGLHVLSKSNFKTLDDLVNYCKKNPGLKYGVMIGSWQHLIITLFAKQAGIKMTPVPFTGDIPCTQALLGEHIPVSVITVSPVQSLIEAGTIRTLAVFPDIRIKEFPKLPTLKEQGYDVGIYALGYGMFAPKDTPDRIVQKLEAVMKQIDTMPEFQEKLMKIGMMRRFVGTPDFKKLLDKERELCTKAYNILGPLDVK